MGQNLKHITEMVSNVFETSVQSEQENFSLTSIEMTVTTEFLSRP